MVPSALPISSRRAHAKKKKKKKCPNFERPSLWMSNGFLELKGCSLEEHSQRSGGDMHINDKQNFIPWGKTRAEKWAKWWWRLLIGDQAHIGLSGRVHIEAEWSNGKLTAGSYEFYQHFYELELVHNGKGGKANVWRILFKPWQWCHSDTTVSASEVMMHNTYNSLSKHSHHATLQYGRWPHLNN